MQADSAQAATSGPVAQGTGALMDMVNNIGPIAMFVLGLLLVSSLYSWTIIFGKMGSFGKATNESRKFIRAFRKATRLNEISALAENYKASPLAQVFEEVYETYKRQTGGSGPPRNITALERSAQTAASESITNMERRMTWLATIAASAATLRAVAPGISEALITTAAGLFVAVPAVVAYNQFTAKLRVLASATDDFCRELLNSFDEIPDHAPRGSAIDSAQETARGAFK
jgi:biopolymer transport protein TolQ